MQFYCTETTAKYKMKLPRFTRTVGFDRTFVSVCGIGQVNSELRGESD
jgi:hypothetical protein